MALNGISLLIRPFQTTKKCACFLISDLFVGLVCHYIFFKPALIWVMEERGETMRERGKREETLPYYYSFIVFVLIIIRE